MFMAHGFKMNMDTHEEWNSPFTRIPTGDDCRANAVWPHKAEMKVRSTTDDVDVADVVYDAPSAHRRRRAMVPGELRAGGAQGDIPARLGCGRMLASL